MREASAKRSPGGSTGFVRKDLLTRRWYNVDDKIARDKCSQALRDLIKSRRGNVTKKRSSTSNLQSHQDEQSDSEDDSSLGSKRLRRDRMWSSSPVMSTAKINGVVPQGYTSYYHLESLRRPYSPAAPEERLFTPDTHPFLPEAHLSSMDSTVQATQILSRGGSHFQTNAHPPMVVATFHNQLSAELEPTPLSDNPHHHAMPPIIQREDSTMDLLRHIVPTVPVASVPQKAGLVNNSGNYRNFVGRPSSSVANLPQSSPSTTQWHEQNMLPTVIGTDHFFRFTGRPDHDPPHPPQHNFLPNITKSSPDVDGGQKPAATMGKGRN